MDLRESINEMKNFVLKDEFDDLKEFVYDETERISKEFTKFTNILYDKLDVFESSDPRNRDMKKIINNILNIAYVLEDDMKVWNPDFDEDNLSCDAEMEQMLEREKEEKKEKYKRCNFPQPTKQNITLEDIQNIKFIIPENANKKKSMTINDILKRISKDDLEKIRRGEFMKEEDIFKNITIEEKKGPFIPECVENDEQKNLFISEEEAKKRFHKEENENDIITLEKIEKKEEKPKKKGIKITINTPRTINERKFCIPCEIHINYNTIITIPIICDNYNNKAHIEYHNVLLYTSETAQSLKAVYKKDVVLFERDNNKPPFAYSLKRINKYLKMLVKDFNELTNNRFNLKL